MPPPIEHLNLEWFWSPPGTERVSTTQTLFLEGTSTTPLLVPPFKKKLFFRLRRNLAMGINQQAMVCIWLNFRDRPSQIDPGAETGY